MTTAAQLALTVGPLIAYLYVLAIWQSGRHPRIVAGPLDYGMLLFGLSGLVVFGPIGRLLLVRPGPQEAPNLWAWAALMSALAILALPWLPRAFRRVVVYNAEPEPLRAALRAVLDDLPGQFEPTLRGYEDVKNGRGVMLETTSWLRSGVIEAYGDGAETLITLVGRGLQKYLRGPVRRPSPVAWGLLGSCLALLVPTLVLLLTRPQARAVFRAFFQRLHGG